ncbi:MAG: hypothetical protein BRC41_16190 [Cyanobacteria bacterium QH_9_48_43]|nr:MAG: hypothetical protein BRC41_16190 [Cyanobacteria bacterium QH_9_48_43]
MDKTKLLRLAIVHLQAIALPAKGVVSGWKTRQPLSPTLLSLAMRQLKEEAGNGGGAMTLYSDTEIKDSTTCRQ